MFNKKFEERLRLWHTFRLSLETSLTPIEDTIKFYSSAPLVLRQVDPYNTNTWLSPWELLYENQYCDFSKLLAISYSLKLTDRFSLSKFEIYICTDKDNSEVQYLLQVDDITIGCHGSNAIVVDKLPTSWCIEKQYTL
jgi:hypothetical protein